MIKEVIRLIKESELGILSDMQPFIIRFWLYYQIYWTKQCVLIYSLYKEKWLDSFILYNTHNKEIVIIAVDPCMRNMGIGTELIKKVPKDTIVVHRKNHRSYNFFRKNGFVKYIDLNPKQLLSIKR